MVSCFSGDGGSGDGDWVRCGGDGCGGGGGDGGTDARNAASTFVAISA